MSLENRSSSALFKRAEQLKRWEQSETNREPPRPRQVTRKIKFSADCVFLAACAAGDKDEVIRLLQKGADINTGNVDGLTALHQACIDDDLDMVEFLVEQGADINRGDNEGWTPLHATASCGFISIAKSVTVNPAEYLIEQGCNLAAVNNDGELALDIAESDEMEEMLQKYIDKAGKWSNAGKREKKTFPNSLSLIKLSHGTGRHPPFHYHRRLHVVAQRRTTICLSKKNQLCKIGIDCDQARSEEERLMLSDARAWRSGAPGKDAVHPRSGATALHVAAAKGYTTVMNILLQARCDVNARDNDGWTPLHAAAHWGQREACRLLVENYCDMDIKNYAGQTAFDIVDSSILNTFEELKKKQEVLLKDHPQIINKQPAIPKKRVSTNKENLVIDQEGTETYVEETPNKVKKVELEIQSDKEESSVGTNSDVEEGVDTDVDASEGESESETSSDTQTSTCSDQSNKSNRSNNSTCLTDDEKKNRVNREERASHSPQPSLDVNKVPNQAPVAPPKQQIENNDEGSIPSWRRSGSFRNRGLETEATNSISTRIEEREKPVIKTPPSPTKVPEEPEVVLRRTHSFETDEKKKEIKLNLELTRVPQGNSLQSPSLPNKSLPTSPVSNLSANAVISPLPANQIRRSFVPPVRDEESETQRKAHAKRVRETRRSTQGVTLDEIKSAEQLVKKKQQQSNDVAGSTATGTTTTASVTQGLASAGSNSTTTASITATITTASPTTVSASKPSPIASSTSTTGTTAIQSQPSLTTTATTTTTTTTTSAEVETNLPERRPSWRLKVDSGSKFQLEDANNRSTSVDTTTAYIRRPTGGGGGGGSTLPRPSSAPVDSIASSTAETTVTLPLRRPLKPPEDKEQDKENDSRNAQATQAVIQRRRRPKRRSTGVVHVDMDEIDPEKQDIPASGDYDDTKINHNE
ncbi:hypothetical protein TSAR_004087, partial [Trichomalopsis sarcophagae]